MNEVLKRENQNLFDKILFTFKGVPKSLWIALASTFIFGLVTHMMGFVNIWPSHDNSTILSASNMSFWEEIKYNLGAGRFVLPIIRRLFCMIPVPWLNGIVYLMLYAISAWMFCNLCAIRHPVFIVLICALFVTNPTSIASGLYMSSGHMWATALLFSILSLHFFFKGRKVDHFLSFIFLFLTINTYIGYVSVTISFFLLLMIMKILFEEQGEIKQFVKIHFLMLFEALFAMGISGLLIFYSSRNSNLVLQDRVAASIGNTIGFYIENFCYSIFYFLYSVYREVTGTWILFFLFIFAMVSTVAVIFYLITETSHTDTVC